jgi:hypothetical protein
MTPDLFVDPPLSFRPIQRGIHIRRRGGMAPVGLHQGISDSEIEELHRLGFGGVTLSVAAARYLEDPEAWEHLRSNLRTVRRLGMRAWIRDDRSRPSGKVDGRVLERYPRGQSRGLAHVSVPFEGPCAINLRLPRGEVVYLGALQWRGDELTLDGAVRLEAAVEAGVLHADLAPGRWTIAAFVEQAIDGGTFAHDPGAIEDKPYINIIDEEAVRHFIELNYDVYAREIGEFFGTVVTGFHTDEPMLTTTAFPVTSPFPPYPMVPWVHDLAERFEDRYRYDLIPVLAALCESVGPSTARIRCDFYRLVGDLCGQAYTAQLANWCGRHGIRLKHQPLGEESLVTHTAFEGSIFAFMRPAQTLCADLLSATVETFKSRDQCLPAAKIVSSVGHVHGQDELSADFGDAYQLRGGVPTTVDDLRAGMSWTYVLGMTDVCSLSLWRDRPPGDWAPLTDYMGRLALFARHGVSAINIAVLYPIASVWATYRPSTEFLMKPPIGSLGRPKIWSETYASEASVWDSAFRDVVWTLLEHQRDHDIVDDDALSTATTRDGQLHVGHGRYAVLILPPSHALDKRSLETAQAFAAGGGTTIGWFPLPQVSAQVGADDALSDSARDLFPREIPPSAGFLQQSVGAGRSLLVADSAGLLAALDECLPPDVRLDRPNTRLMACHRRDGARDAYLLVNLSDEHSRGTVCLQGSGLAQLWNPLDGAVGALDARVPQPGFVSVELDVPPCSGTIVTIGEV